MIYGPLTEIMVTKWELVQHFNEPRITALLGDLSTDIHPGATKRFITTHTIVRPRQKFSILRFSSLLTKEAFEVPEGRQDSKNMDSFLRISIDGAGDCPDPPYHSIMMEHNAHKLFTN